MTCGLYGGLEVAFLRSGVVVTPLEATTRSQSKDFSYTKCKVKREDGEYIAEHADEYEPVELRVDGTVQDRYMFHPEAVDLHNRDATLSLYDAEKILERGTINTHFQNTTVADVVDHIVENRQDPNRVIHGVKHPSEQTQDLLVRNSPQLGEGGWIGRIIGAGLGVAAILTRSPEAVDTSLNLTDMTPFGALKKTTSSFALDTWVDRDGWLNYGMRGANPNTYTLAPRGTGIKLKEYNVTVGSGKLTEVILQGNFSYVTNKMQGIEGTGVGPSTEDPKTTFSYGKAQLVDGDGNRLPGQTLSPDTEIPTNTPSGVEDAARRTLVNHYMDRKNGNIVINGGSSTDKKGLVEIAVGDLIESSAEINDHCRRHIDTGIFSVRGVRHKLDKRRGWLVDIDVAALPASDIASESWLESPSRDVRWESIDDYKNSNPS